MRSLVTSSVLLALSASIEGSVLKTRQSDSNGTAKACIPQSESDTSLAARKEEVSYRHDNFLYNISQIGKAAAFPMGKLGEERVRLAWDQWQDDRNNITVAIQKDMVKMTQALKAHNGSFKTLDDYVNVLYSDQWDASNPTGEVPGSLTNFTLDSFFGGERLVRPYTLYKAQEEDCKLIEISDEDAKKIAGKTVAELLADGKLFAVNHTYQADTETYPQTEYGDKYGAPVSALFFINDDKELLPLGIRTNVGKDFTYTSLDEPNDWLLAKIMFNAADQFHNQMFHLTATHNVGEALHEAAMRTLSDNHPIMVVLDRLNYQAYSARPVGEALCFNKMGHWDENFHISQVGCRNFVTNTWAKYGAFQSNYLDVDFKARGLIDDEGAYPFKTFPFWQDANRIVSIQRDFYKSFIDTYYTSDADVESDYEVKAWFEEIHRGPTGPEVEAQGLIPVQDFPEKATKEVLVDVLTHNAWLQIAHHTINAGDAVRNSLTLPFHPGGLYKPVPETKGIDDAALISFLPNATAAVNYIVFTASFNRPRYQIMEQPRTLSYAYSGKDFLARFGETAVQKAAAEYHLGMGKFCAENAARKIESDGMCTDQGIPFCYISLDPCYIPWFFSV